MSTYRLPAAVVPLVDWTSRYAARRRLWPAAAPGAYDLTPRDAAHVIRTIDVVCDDAPSSELPFEAYAALDELGANLADWLRHVAADRARGAQRAA
jgi:hypothetical protein